MKHHFRGCVFAVSVAAACTPRGSSQGTQTTADEPAKPAAESCIQLVVTGDGIICVLRTNGSVLCFGRIKDFTDAGANGKVMDVPPLQHISSQPHGFFGVTRNGEAVGWALNEERAKPLEGLSADNTSVEYTGQGYCALEQDGEVRCQRRNNPVPASEAPLVFTQVSKLDGQVAITPRGVEVWGKNQLGWLGTTVPVDDHSDHPATPVAGLPGKVLDVASASGAVCALSEQGEVWCWGDGSSGSLGPGPERFHHCPHACSEAIRPTPLRVQLPKPVKDLAAPSAMCALLDDGSIWCWGWNAEGLVKTPVVVTHRAGGMTFNIEPTPAKNESFGDDNTRIFGDLGNLCALKRDGSLWCAGGNHHSQVPSKPVNGKMLENVPATRMNVTCD